MGGKIKISLCALETEATARAVCVKPPKSFLLGEK
jgi:hypothetical protein